MRPHQAPTCLALVATVTAVSELVCPAGWEGLAGEADGFPEKGKGLGGKAGQEVLKGLGFQVAVSTSLPVIRVSAKRFLSP